MAPREEVAVRWSVGIEAEGERIFTREDIVELADAIADHDGIASGIGTSRYGARLVVEADTRQDAISQAANVFQAAAKTAGLPAAPVIKTEAISEAEAASLASRGGEAGEEGESR
jgi:hypothetical protein